MSRTAKEVMQELINAVEAKKGYVDDHKINRSPIFGDRPVATLSSEKEFAGCCIIGNNLEKVGFLMNSPIFCINAFYLSEKGFPHLSRRSIGGLINGHNICSKEDLQRFNDTVYYDSNKITHVLLKDGTYLEL